MATLTKIFTGMTGGPEAIQGNFDTLNGLLGQPVTLGPQTNSGLTWVNGFKDQDNGYFKYQTMTIGTQKFLMISGQIAYSQSIKAWSSTQMVKFPDGIGIGNAHMISGSLGVARDGTNFVSYSVEADGLYVMPFYGDISYNANAAWLPGISIIATI